MIFPSFTLGLLLVSGCNNAEEDLQELSESYDIPLSTVEAETNVDENDEEIVELDYEQIEHMFMYISESLQEDEAEGFNDSDYFEWSAGGTNAITLQSDLIDNQEEHEIYVQRHFAFSYEAEEDHIDIQLADDSEIPTITAFDEGSAISGMLPGLDWNSITASVHAGDESEQQELFFSALGEWEGHFIYEDLEVNFNLEDEWETSLTLDEFVVTP